MMRFVAIVSGLCCSLLEQRKDFCTVLTISDVKPSSTVRFDSLFIISCAIFSHSSAFAETRHGTWP